MKAVYNVDNMYNMLGNCYMMFTHLTSILGDCYLISTLLEVVSVY